MKNKVARAIIIGAGACGGLCSAQSNVAMYGIMDMGVVSESGGAGGRVLKVTSGIANGSRQTGRLPDWLLRLFLSVILCFAAYQLFQKV